VGTVVADDVFDDELTKVVLMAVGIRDPMCKHGIQRPTRHVWLPWDLDIEDR
jgi:hypothetical protein